MTPAATSPCLLLVDWDAADWKVIDPLMSKGEMPNLAKLVNEGVRGNLATMYPPLSPMLWTSIATGKRSSKTGIHGFSELTQDGLGVRPITNLVVGWWPSHPAEPIRGAVEAAKDDDAKDGAKQDRHAPAFERWDGAPPPYRSRAVIVVTGLPRSGTSMTMQMLAAGGIEPYTDSKREADEDNPRGYFEHEQATRLHRDASWIPEARGKAVKIVAHLLPFLPAGEEYRLIFMRRDLKEVVASQKAMLERLGRKGANIGDAALMRTYAGQLVQVQNWLRKTPGVQAITIDYAEALADAAGAATRLGAFLGAPFDAAKAAASVDAKLRRQR